MAFRFAVERIEPPDDPVDGGGVEPGGSPQPVDCRWRQRYRAATWRGSPNACKVAAAFEQAADAALTDAVVAHRFAFQAGDDGLDREDLAARRREVEIQDVEACRVQLPGDLLQAFGRGVGRRRGQFCKWH